MKTHFNLKAAALCLLLLPLAGCTDNAAEPAPTCHEGTVIAPWCPGQLVVQVKGASIGTRWEYKGQTYDNAVLLGGGNGYKPGSTVFFVIDTAKTVNECPALLRCTANITDLAPAKEFCIQFISNQSCSEK